MKGGLVFKQKTILIFIFLILNITPVSIYAQLDDPTRPPGHKLILSNGKKQASTKYFSLTSVRISIARRSAIVNDRNVESGDIVDGAKVIAIYPSAVKLKKKGKLFTIRLISQLTKKTKLR